MPKDKIQVTPSELEQLINDLEGKPSSETELYNLLLVILQNIDPETNLTLTSNYSELKSDYNLPLAEELAPQLQGKSLYFGLCDEKVFFLLDRTAYFSLTDAGSPVLDAYKLAMTSVNDLLQVPDFEVKHAEGLLRALKKVTQMNLEELQAFDQPLMASEITENLTNKRFYVGNQKGQLNAAVGRRLIDVMISKTPNMPIFHESVDGHYPIFDPIFLATRSEIFYHYFSFTERELALLNENLISLAEISDNEVVPVMVQSFAAKEMHDLLKGHLIRSSDNDPNGLAFRTFNKIFYTANHARVLDLIGHDEKGLYIVAEMIADLTMASFWNYFSVNPGNFEGITENDVHNLQSYFNQFTNNLDSNY